MTAPQILSVTGIDKNIDFHHTASADLIRICFALVKKNMKPLYDAAGGDWTWSDQRKLAELRHEDMRYLVFADSGFLAFRFEWEGAVAYIYEVHAAVPGRGVGSALMAALERLCVEKTEIRKLMLTVLRGNSEALAFYRRRGWREDEDSPADAAYVILCKLI